MTTRGTFPDAHFFNMTINGDVSHTSGTASKPVFTLENTTADANATKIKFFKNAGDRSAADGDKLGTIAFHADSADATDVNYANIITTQEDSTAGADNASMVFQIMTADTVTEVARLNPESYTANTFCGGFGWRYPIFTPGADGTLTAGMSGAVVLMSAGDDVKLPTPALGLHYTFYCPAAISSTAATITSTSDGSTGRDLFTGIVTTNGSPTSTVDKDVITFVADTATEGDYVEVICISATITANNPTWFYRAYGDAAGAITVA